MFRNRVRTYALIGAAAVAGVLAAVVPAMGNSHGTLDYVEFVANDSVSARFIQASAPGSPQILTFQGNGCRVSDADERLIDLEALNGNQGLARESLGVRVNGPGANGTPCSQVQENEALILNAGSTIDAFARVEFDLEMTGDAIVQMTFDTSPDIYELHTGNAFHALCATTQPGGAPWPGCGPDADPTAAATVVTPTGVLKSACASPNSSGPNSGANDNCIWKVDPGFEFSTVQLAVKNGIGTVSFEGGYDTGLPSKLYIAANEAPVANDQDVFVDYQEDTNGEPIAAPAFGLDVSDPNGDTLTFVDGDSSTTPGFPATTTEGGTLSLIGSSVTYTPPQDFTGTDSFTYTVYDGEFWDSATVTIYEVLDCGETLSITDGTITAEYLRLFPEEGGCDVAKPYDVEIVPVVGEDSVVRFQPKPREGDPVPDCSIAPDEDSETPDAGDCTDEFLGVLSFGTESETNAPTTGTLEYDPVVRDDPDPSAFRAMKWCEFDPTDPPSGVARRNALPSGESWCIIEVNVSIANSAKTITNWYVYGIGDPFKRLS